MFFTVFYAYLYKVLDYTLFQFQTSLVLTIFYARSPYPMDKRSGKHKSYSAHHSHCQRTCKTSLLNILLLIPFGFGLPFITIFA